MAAFADTGSTADPRYTKVAIWLHWLIGVAVIANIGLAMLTEDLPRETHRAAMGLHKSIGMAILALTVLRILWRLTHKSPPLPPMATWERVLSRAAHFAFYALLILLPLSGWVWMSAADRPIDFFGLFTIPSIVAASKDVADVMHERHEVLGLTMLALVLIHILAALKLQYADKVRIFGRMNPF